MNWSRIIGVLTAVWGAGILISFVLRGAPLGTGAYGAGSLTGLVVGLLLLVSGLYYAITGGRPGKKEER